jgi:large subunit ribosomal protein L4
MATMEVLDQSGQKVGELTLNEEIFSGDIKTHLIHEVVKMQLANRRAGTASTKNRSAVRGGGKKPWRQKGTGRARVGTIRSPLWRGGGVVFGPVPRDYSYKVPKKIRKGALRSAVASKAEEGKLVIVDKFELPEIKTREFAKILKELSIQEGLIVIEGRDDDLERSSRNIPSIKVLRFEGLNVYDIMRYDTLVMTQQAFEKLEGVLAQ